MQSHRALKGWRKVAPAGSQLPLPLLLAQGLMPALCSHDRRDVALYLGTCFLGYLRPSEGLALKARDVVPGVQGAAAAYQHLVLIVRNSLDGVPDKVGVFDNSVVMDAPYLREVGPQLVAMKHSRQAGDLLFNFELEEATKAWHAAATAVGYHKKLSLYQCRHGGASHDMVEKHRSRDEVRQRGRWVTDSSVRRYVKIGKVQNMLRELTDEGMRYCRSAARNLDAVLSGRRPADPPPR